MATADQNLSAPLSERLSQTSPSKTKSVPAPEDLWDRIDDWRVSQRPVLTFAAAARDLLEAGLVAKTTEPRRSKPKKPD